MVAWSSTYLLKFHGWYVTRFKFATIWVSLVLATAKWFRLREKLNTSSPPSSWSLQENGLQLRYLKQGKPSPAHMAYFPEGAWHKADAYRGMALTCPNNPWELKGPTFMKPFRDFCRQWPLECDQMSIMLAGRNPKSFWPLMKILEKTLVQLIDVLVYLLLYRYARYSWN